MAAPRLRHLSGLTNRTHEGRWDRLGGVVHTDRRHRPHGCDCPCGAYGRECSAKPAALDSGALNGAQLGRLRLRCWRAAFAFARRLRIWSALVRVVPPGSVPSGTGALRRASRRTKTAIAPISTAAPRRPKTMGNDPSPADSSPELGLPSSPSSPPVVVLLSPPVEPVPLLSLPVEPVVALPVALLVESVLPFVLAEPVPEAPWELWLPAEAPVLGAVAAAPRAIAGISVAATIAVATIRQSVSCRTPRTLAVTVRA